MEATSCGDEKAASGRKNLLGKRWGLGIPRRKKVSNGSEGWRLVPQTWWPYEFAGSTRNASAEMKNIYEGEKTFDTPKPEKLIMRVLEVATTGGDLVLDSFGGSGTTAAVAHKMVADGLW